MSECYTVTSYQDDGQEFLVKNEKSVLAVSGDNLLPTELFLASLSSCIHATLVEYAERNEISVEGVAVKVEGRMANRPRRIDEIYVTYVIPETLPTSQADALVRAGNRCTVHNSLKGDLEIKFLE